MFDTGKRDDGSSYSKRSERSILLDQVDTFRCLDLLSRFPFPGMVAQFTA